MSNPTHRSETSPNPSASEADATLELLRSAFQAARAGNVAELRRLLDLGVPVHMVNEAGDGLLMLASYHRHHEATQLLLERGADPQKVNDRGQVPLAGAAFNGDVKMTELLLRAGARADASSPDGKTPLMFAAMFDRVEVIDLLLQFGADPSRRDASGISALDMALKMGATRAAARLESLVR